MITNLLAELPPRQREELIEVLRETPTVRIERIVSHGHASPEGFWYDQPTAEWVLLLCGAAKLQFEGGEPFDLTPGDALDIPAHRRHRVVSTAPDQSTVWLAIHYHGVTTP